MDKKEERPLRPDAPSGADISEFSTSTAWAEKVVARQSEASGGRARVWWCVGWVGVLRDIPELADKSDEELQRMLCDDAEYVRIQQLAMRDDRGWLKRLSDEMIPCVSSPWHRFDPSGERNRYKKAHVHVLFRFEGKKSYTQIQAIVRRVFGNHASPGIQAVESVPGAARYLCHLDQPGKYQYPTDGPFGPVEFAGFDVEPYFAMSEAQRKDALDQLFRLAEDGGYGELCRFVPFVREYHPDLYAFLLGDSAYPKVAGYLRSLHFSKKEEKAERAAAAVGTKRVVYVYGESGVGKTLFAKRYGKENGLSSFIAGAGNDPLQGYDGSQVLVLDEIRPRVFEWADLLKLLDPHTTSLAAARYKNVDVSPVCCVIMTSVLSPQEFVCGVRGVGTEDWQQFFRRISCVMHITRDLITYERVDGTPINARRNNLLESLPSDDEGLEAFMQTLYI